MKYSVELRINQYDLEGFADLKYQHQSGQKTIKEIKNELNISIGVSAMVEAGGDPRPGEAKYNYQYLKDDQGPADRELTIQRLENIGVDTDLLLRDLLFREHIENYLGVDPDPLK